MNFARWCAANPGAAVALLAAIVIGIAIGIVLDPKPDPVERVTISCPVGTVQIVKVDNTWTCVQEGETR